MGKARDLARISPDSSGRILLPSGVAGVLPDANAPSGSVIQVVSATFSTQTDFTTTAYVDTGLTATITPISSSSKILVIVFQAGLWKATNPVYGELRLLRGATSIARFEGEFGQASTMSIGFGSAGTVIHDSPNTTSPVVYKTQCYSSGSTIQLQRNSATSTIALLEIAA
jgi:hypothetical protein